MSGGWWSTVLTAAGKSRSWEGCQQGWHRCCEPGKSHSFLGGGTQGLGIHAHLVVFPAWS